MEADMRDPFIGTWTLNPAKSQFDANHRPSSATMRFERDSDGAYVMNAEGTNDKGEAVVERPQRLVPDGQPYPVPDFPGLRTVTSRPQPNVIRAEVRREDGTIAGEGSYAVTDDGRSLSATTAGFDTQLRRFEMRTVWDRK
jgi:hypothetical protein